MCYIRTQSAKPYPPSSAQPDPSFPFEASLSTSMFVTGNGWGAGTSTSVPFATLPSFLKQAKWARPEVPVDPHLHHALHGLLDGRGHRPGPVGPGHCERRSAAHAPEGQTSDIFPAFGEFGLLVVSAHCRWFWTRWAANQKHGSLCPPKVFVRMPTKRSHALHPRVGGYVSSIRP